MLWNYFEIEQGLPVYITHIHVYTYDIEDTWHVIGNDFVKTICVLVFLAAIFRWF